MMRALVMCARKVNSIAQIICSTYHPSLKYTFEIAFFSGPLPDHIRHQDNYDHTLQAHRYPQLP